MRTGVRRCPDGVHERGPSHEAVRVDRGTGFVARAEEEERQKEGKGELVQAAAVAFCKAAKQGNHTQERYLVSPLKCGKEKSNRDKKKVS